jgi:protein-tyrosine phosphatase
VSANAAAWDDRFRLGPAGGDEEIVFGACRPGYPSRHVEQFIVDEWTDFLKRNGISRVCCLLESDQLSYYPNDLIESNRRSFGERNVCHAPLKDRHICDGTLHTVVLPFLHDSHSRHLPVAVYCSGGSGRTGQVLAAWLINARRMTFENAIAAVKSSNRNPCESFEVFGNGSEDMLRSVLQHKDIE